MATFWFIRHGESTAQAKPDVIGGRSPDAEITTVGASQARALGYCLGKDKTLIGGFDDLWRSTLIRAKQTCDLMMAEMGSSCERPMNTPSPIVDSRLIELDQGKWQGEDRKSVYTPHMIQLIESNTLHFCAPGGESQFQVTERMLSWLYDALRLARTNRTLRESIMPSLRSLNESDYNIAVVGHGYAIRCLLCNLFDIPNRQAFHIKIDNCSITKVRIWSDDFDHLENNLKCNLDCLNFVYPDVKYA
ncbi:MAG: histidine phosphatase family protein [Synergistaceae bacterium]